MPLATVDPIKESVAWSAKGSAGDALQRVPHDSPFLAIWLDENDCVKWSKANTSLTSLAIFAAVLQELSSSCVREALK